MKRHPIHKKVNGIYLKVFTGIFLLFGMAIMLFPTQQKTPVLNEVQFVWNPAQLANVHGTAWDQWDYLFADTWSTDTGTNTQVTNTATPTEGLLITTGTFTQQTTIQPTNPTPTISNSSFINAMQQAVNQVIGSASQTQSSNWLFIWTFGIGTWSTGGLWLSSGVSQYIQNQVQIQQTQIPKDCTTPRGTRVKSKDFVLAYQQRDDVDTICNVERRICTDGVLEGSYTQRSCKENVTYSYQTAPIVSYNQEVINPLVQPDPAVNSGATFSTQGKINGTLQPITTIGTEGQSATTTPSGVNQTVVSTTDCITPRGAEITHGQFIKAYKSSIGLIDVPCETELRLCINGVLKGSFTNKTCTVKDMTYNDYIAGNTDINSPTPQDIIQSIGN